VIADLSVNHVERHALRCGYSIERIEHDYGTDLVLWTYTDDGEVENGQVYFQLKATDALVVLADQQTITFIVESADLELWLQEAMPYILVVYDARADTAYWLYLQAYFEGLPNFDLDLAGDTVTVRLSKANILNEDAMYTFARYKRAVAEQLKGKVEHDVQI